MALHVPDPYFTQLAQLYRQMDHAYDRAARAAGFQCRGCEDNCCRSLFFHHTYLEYFYLQKGLQTLDPARGALLEQSALEHCRRTEETLAGGGRPRLFCPLNEGARCILYAYRPMICRLHGVAHRMRLPDGRIHSGPGCADFEKLGASDDCAVLDRTPFYQAMAGLEQALRRDLGLKQKIKRTVAQLIGPIDLV